MKNIIFKASVLLLFVMGCRPSPEPIQYGGEKCTYCTMTIIDQRFGSEIITHKGKVYKFDAMECLINFRISKGLQDDQIYQYLTNSFDKPGKFTNARECFYLKSKTMPSPMGMFISPFTDSLSAVLQEAENPGKILQFKELNEFITSQ